MRKQYAIKDYAKMMEGNLGEFALGVGGNISSKPIFASLSELGGKITAKATEFNTAVATGLGGNATDRAHKKTVRGELLALLDSGADGVNNLAQGNVETLTASGYHLSCPNNPTPLPVGTVSITGLVNVASTKLGLTLAITGNVWAVVVERQNADGTWTKLAMFTDLNDTVLMNLVPGTAYTFRVCAMAAGNQTSEWSAPFSGICT